MAENTEQEVNQETHHNYSEDILKIIRSNLPEDEIRDKLDEYHENDIADVLPQLTKEERIHLLEILGADRIAEVMEYVDNADDYLKELDDARAAGILAGMESDEAVDLLKECGPDYADRVLSKMPPETGAQLRRMAAYDEDVIGSRMTTNFVSVYMHMSVPEAMKSVIAQAADHDNIAEIFVVDERKNYRGEIDLKDLIIARKDTSLEDITVTAFPSVYADEKIADCLSSIQDYGEEAIPVLSRKNTILGAVTAADLAEVVDDEMSDDYAKLGGLSEEEDLNEPVMVSVKKRLPWLILLCVLGILVSTVVSLFETVVVTLPVIMAFQSMILDMSGNVGTQSLAVTIRVLMDENLSHKEKNKFIRKEMTTGFINGLITGLFAFVFVGVYLMLLKKMPAGQSFLISLCIGASLLVAMVISSGVGTSVPMFFKKIGVDPAVASGPLITTITDLVGVVCFYGLAWILLIETFHLG